MQFTSPRLRGEVGAERRVRGASTYVVLQHLRRKPLTPTLSPQVRGEGEVAAAHRRNL